MTWRDRIDNAIEMLSPSWGEKRKHARFVSDHRSQLRSHASKRIEARMQRAFDAADNGRLRGHRWMASKLSVNSILDGELGDMVARCKEQYRNNSIAASAIDGRVDNVVGKGYTFQSRIQPFDGLISREEARQWNQRIEQKHNVWKRAVRKASKQREACRCYGIYGEFFVLMWDDPTSEAPVPLNISVISPERVETPPDKVGRKNIRLGVEFDRNGSPVAYYVRRSEPHDYHEVDYTYDRVPASRMCHVFRKMFPSQVRGVPWLSPVLAPLKDIGDFMETHLINEQASALTMAFIKTPDPMAKALGAAAEVTASGDRIEEMYPAAVEYIGQDDEIVFTDPNRPGGTFAPYIEFRTRQVAAGLRYPYEILAKHFQNNYSGGRLALIDGRITFGIWQQEEIEGCWDRVDDRFVYELIALGEVDIDPDQYQDNPELYNLHTEIPNGVPWVDPNKETNAELDGIAGGIGSRTHTLLKIGQDREELDRVREEEAIAKLEMEARIEQRRKELAAELGDEGFGRNTPMPGEEPEQPQEQQQEEADVVEA